MDTGWVRLSRTCNNACVFCLDAEQLDGKPVPLDRIEADIDAVADAGCTKVVLSGGEPTLTKHLLAAIRHAKSRDLYVSMTTNGRIIQSDKIAQMLEETGLDEIRVSVHAGRRSSHDKLAGKKMAWVESLAGLRFMGKTKVRTVMNTMLLAPTQSEMAHLMHLGTMGGIAEMHLRRLQQEGSAADPEHHAALQVPIRVALRTVSTLWYEAKEEVILFTVDGFDHTLDLGLAPEGQPHQADRAALRMLRDRVQLHSALKGTKMLSEQGMAKDFKAMVAEQGDLSTAGHELAARGAPLLDAPRCVGGIPQVPADHWGDKAYHGEGCEGCPARQGCAGLPRKLRKIDEGSLRPSPHWSGVGTEGRAVVVGGADALLRDLTLPALAEALTAEGLDATYASEVSEAVDDAVLVVCGDAEAARQVLARPGRREGQRVEVLDTTFGADLHDLSGEGLTIRAFGPGRVEGLRDAGVTLHDVLWRPYPVAKPAEGVAAPKAEQMVAIGATADWSLLREAVGQSRNILPKTVVFSTADNPCVPAPNLEVHEDADDAAILDAIAQARLVILPLRRLGRTAAGHRQAAADLRWAGVAHALGKPVVATRGPAHDDQVRDEVSAMLARPGDAVHLSEQIRRVCNEAKRLKQYTLGARQLGELSHPSVWAKELVHGVPPEGPARLPGTTRPWPAW